MNHLYVKYKENLSDIDHPGVACQRGDPFFRLSQEYDPQILFRVHPHPSGGKDVPQEGGSLHIEEALLEVYVQPML